MYAQVDLNNTTAVRVTHLGRVAVDGDYQQMALNDRAVIDCDASKVSHTYRDGVVYKASTVPLVPIPVPGIRYSRFCFSEVSVSK